MVEAIRRYREAAGVGLKEAKEAVEMLASGGAVEARQVVISPLTADQAGQVLEQVQELLRTGNKLDAIHHYRESTDVSMAKAKEVVDRVDAALRGIPLEPRPEIPGAPSFSQAAEPTRRRARFISLVALAFLLLAGGIVLAVFASSGGVSAAMLVANGPAVIWTSETGSPRLAVSFYNINDENNLIGMIDGNTGNLLWRSEPLPGDGMADGIVQGGGLVYAACDMNLLAYRVEDGSLAWQTTMPDTLNYGEATLLVTAGRVLTMNVDQSVQAYDAQSGALVWSRRLGGYDRTLRLVDGGLLLFDYVNDDYEYDLLLLDPLDGSEAGMFTPECPISEYSSSSLSPSSGMLYDEGEEALYLVFDSSTGCVQRLDLKSGQPSWYTLDEDWYGFSSIGFQGLLTEERLYFNNDDEIMAVDKSTGALQVLLQDEDFELIPLAVSGETLLVRARRTRGSERFELRGVDRFSGETLWQMDLGEAEPIDPPDEMIGLVDEGDEGWTWRVMGGDLQLLTFHAKPHQLSVQNIDLEDGMPSGEMSIPLKGVSGDFYSVPSVISWQGEWLYLELDAKIYRLNITSGEVDFHVP